MYGSNTFAEGYMIGRDSTGSGNSNGGFGNMNDGWWIILLLLCGWGGYGNRGFGGFGGGDGSGAANGYVLATDFASIERKIDGVNNGLCDGFYAVNTAFGNLNNTLATNTAQLQNSLNQGFAGVNTALVTQGYENRIATNGLGTQLASCCCDIREGISGINYNMATQANMLGTQIANCCCETQRQIERGFCDTNYTSMNNTRDIIQSTHSDTDRILAKLDAIEDSRKDREIAALQSENQNLRLESKFCASQAAQNAYLVETLRPCPKPAYITCNPYAYQPVNNCCNSCC